MTVNERLFAAGLLETYHQAVALGDKVRVDALLAQVKLRRDRDGTHWSIGKTS